MKRALLSLLAFLTGPALVALAGWVVLQLQAGAELFAGPGRAIVSLGRSVGWFALRDCSTHSKPQVCDLMNAISDMVVQSEAGVVFWVCVASLISGWWAWRVWQRRSAPATHPITQPEPTALR